MYSALSVEGVTSDYRGLPGVTRGYRGQERLPGVLSRNKGLQRVKGDTGVYRDYKGLQGVSRGYPESQGVTGGDKGL